MNTKMFALLSYNAVSLFNGLFSGRKPRRQAINPSASMPVVKEIHPAKFFRRSFKFHERHGNNRETGVTSRVVVTDATQRVLRVGSDNGADGGFLARPVGFRQTHGLLVGGADGRKLFDG